MRSTVCLLLGLVVGQPVFGATILSNLDSSGGDIQNVFAGTGFGVGFRTGSSSYTLNSVGLEEYAYGGPVSYFHVEVYSLGPTGSVPPPGWAWQPYAELADLGTPPGPGSTTVVEYTPSAPVTLSPGQVYMIGAFAGPGSPGQPAVIFASSEAYSVAEDWQMYVAPESNNQWYLDPSYNEWIIGSPGDNEGLKLEVNATAVPEPGVTPIVLTAAAIALTIKRRFSSIPQRTTSQQDT